MSDNLYIILYDEPSVIPRNLQFILFIRNFKLAN